MWVDEGQTPQMCLFAAKKGISVTVQSDPEHTCAVLVVNAGEGLVAETYIKPPVFSSLFG